MALLTSASRHRLLCHSRVYRLARVTTPPNAPYRPIRLAFDRLARSRAPTRIGVHSHSWLLLPHFVLPPLVFARGLGLFGDSGHRGCFLCGGRASGETTHHAARSAPYGTCEGNHAGRLLSQRQQPGLRKL